ncbi:MAG: SusC/RagA family TonB-linked outer membrane protein [Bacteroidales bacterium]|nr:SusC/RagA family TonB-linked outer membrane protein [Bacteroidales bacterium]MDD3906962.1 SusC/RagA family TonB-linked outer membrane protein [Bacteroidales bacterium]MDD4712682.1 SusC/RagA family TonB-linked outer membrane protein [Bacteroidales bacterium]
MKIRYFKVFTLLSLMILCFTGKIQAQETLKKDNATVNSDLINIAFDKVERGDLVGSASTINAEDVAKYDNTQLVSDALLGRVPGLLGYNNIRGIGSALFIVDGLPRDISTLTLAEVDQITVLKDVNASILYGSAAVNGVVLITTKRGNANKPQMKFNLYTGISVPKALPKYLSSSDYMTLYNEARTNDGLTALYSDEMITNYRSGSNKYKYPDVDYYSSEYLKSYKPFSKATAEFSGGNKAASYYSNMGWEQDGTLYDFGKAKNSKVNRFNFRGNVDLKINSFIKSSLDAVAVIVNTTSPVNTSLRDYWTNASILHPNLFAPLIPISMIDPTNSTLIGHKWDVDGKYLLGGTQSYLINPISNGYVLSLNRNAQNTFSFNNKIDFDLGGIVKGLAFHTNLSFDYYTTYNEYFSDTYCVYEPTWTKDSISALAQYGENKKATSQTIYGSSYERRLGFQGILDYNRTFNDVHKVNAILLAYGSIYKQMGDYQGNKNANLGLRLNYSYNNKYMVDFSGAYVNSVKLPSKSRKAFSPSLGLAWMISSEDFMSSMENIDYLKLRLTGGIVNSDNGIGGYYYYLNRWSYSGSYTWSEIQGTPDDGVVSSYGENDNLSFEKRKELNFGIEGSFFKQKLYLVANAFASSYYNQITMPQTTYPSFYNGFIPYENFDDNAYRGLELGLTYTERLGEFQVALGANALYSTSEVMKRDEVYADSYRYRKGHPVDALYGLVADGFYMSDEDIANYENAQGKHVTQTFGTVKPGDIKYVDQNNDGLIDENDQVRIGRSQAPFSYGLNLRLTYKNLSLFALGTGRIGADSYISGSYYWVDQDDKYSEYVLGRWTEATKETATYPRLTTSASSNNFRNSTFWLYRDNYFTLQRVQVTYDFPQKFVKKLRMQGLSCFVDGSSLLTISKHREIKELSIGSEPYYRSFSLGVKTTF